MVARDSTEVKSLKEKGATTESKVLKTRNALKAEKVIFPKQCNRIWLGSAVGLWMDTDLSSSEFGLAVGN